MHDEWYFDDGGAHVGVQQVVAHANVERAGGDHVDEHVCDACDAPFPYCLCSCLCVLAFANGLTSPNRLSFD